MSNTEKNVENFYNTLAPQIDLWKKKNQYYHKQLAYLYRYLIPTQQKVLEIGCGTGNLLSAIQPSQGVGIDISEEMVNIAKKKFSRLTFIKTKINKLQIKEKFDYIILSDLIGILEDIQETFSELHKFATDDTRIIINYNNYLWEPLFSLLTKLGLKTPHPLQSWLSDNDVANLLNLANLEIIKKGESLLLPFYIPFLSTFCNKYLARLPFIHHFCFIKFVVARKSPVSAFKKEYSVSVILPARNEAGNIEKGVREIPMLGKKTEIIFVEDHSKDNTREAIERVIKKYKDKKDIKLFVQKNQYGKAAAVRKGFSMAKGEILIIFDSDLSTEPKDLPKFYNVLRDKKAELVQGSRLIYPIEKDAMRLLNIFGNKFFSTAFTFLLDQPIKDTLCGTKALSKKNYLKIVKHRNYFGNFDPFGDFDLIFGASKLNLKITEVPIRYKARIYGKSNIRRFWHGWLLLQMTIFAAKKIKFF
jgi:SAM-dependent methyltransferase